MPPAANDLRRLAGSVVEDFHRAISEPHDAVDVSYRHEFLERIKVKWQANKDSCLSLGPASPVLNDLNRSQWIGRCRTGGIEDPALSILGHELGAIAEVNERDPVDDNGIRV
ncbi:MAG: hypothetical protein EA421_14005 [Gemmatimonadales bacterium]|nr:MAG: hypothetical protein EA421_14005 [Gemmatimonadales bacterium]